ncbi:flagellar filament capping protein FliD [Clostridium sp.]|uniref:flagellar filament capping protein FliD n=1 Tax=Clostridium sp. TaxID=1506 RepID=UPI002851F6BC|nr:flagellar filament capping protein FliD [Clostridium sp.]MDR3593984.1 flagellar filament capping protein FliD [Clostridium sp.]
MTNALVSSTGSSSTSSGSSTASSSVLRITGMASGIDTDAVVKSMVSDYQAKIDKANQAEQTLQWQQDAYRTIITGIKGLQEYFDPLSSKYILSSNSFDTNTATNSNSSVVSATASSSAKTGTYAVTVGNLATQASIEGTPVSSLVQVNNLSNWTNSPNKLAFDDNGTEVDLSNITGTTTQGLVDNINSQIASSALNGKVTASYVKEVTSSGTTNEYIKFTQASSNTDTINIDSSKTTGILDVKNNTPITTGISSSMALSTLSSNPISFSLSYDSASTTTPVSIVSSSTDTLQSLMDKVSSATNGAVTMSIDDSTGKISFQTKNSGSTSALTITDNGNLSALGIATTTNSTGGTAKSSGTDANVTITEPGGSQVTTTESSNNFTTNGVTYNLVGTGTANTTVTSNTDAVVANIKSFVTDYNTIISTINTKLTEKKDSAYPPLTDAQKASMSADQITAWNAKAQVGVLRNDDNLQNLMTQLRGALAPVYNSYSSTNPSTGEVALSFGSYGTSAVGLDTSNDYTDGGKLVITDPTKLADAITNNPDDFKKLFIGTSSTPLDTTKSYVGSQTYQEDGIFTRMSNILTSFVGDPGIGTDGTSTLSGTMNIFVNKQFDFSSTGYTSGQNTIPDQIYQQTVNITNLNTQMSDAEDRYYAKFSALESAMNTLNSQQSTLTSMLGSS